MAHQVSTAVAASMNILSGVILSIVLLEYALRALAYARASGCGEGGEERKRERLTFVS